MADHDRDVLAEAERLRTGLRCLIRDWAEGWEDCTPFDQRDAYRALAELLGPDYDSDRTWVAPAEPRPYPAGHGYTPATGPFATGDGCRVMLARYPCDYGRDQHDPDLPPEDLDVFGYRRERRRCCPGEGSMAHVRGCVNHPEAER